MKTLQTKKTRYATALLACMLLTGSAYAQSHVTMSLQNITTSKNTIEYDLYVVNDGNTQIKLSACSFGVNYNAEIENGGTITYTFMKHTRSNSVQNLSDYAMQPLQSQTSHQARMTSTPVCFDKAIDLPTNAPYKVGRFRVTNSANWKANSKPQFNLQETTKVNLTTTQVVAYVNNENRLTALTPTKASVSCLVLEDIILNPSNEQAMNANQEASQETSRSLSSSLISSDQETKIYPNPSSGILNVDFTSTTNHETLIVINDLHGRIVKNIQTYTQVGNQHLQLDIHELQPGMYFLKLYQGKELMNTEKFTKK